MQEDRSRRTPSGRPAPAAPAGTIPPRLLDRLDGVPHRRVTLVTAPLGYGKTALAARWCAERCTVPVTWLPPEDLAGADDPATLDATLTAVVGAADADPGPRVLVLDGLDGPEAGTLVTQAARRLPPDVHLLVLSRRQLTTATAALRLTGDLDHLDEADLRLRPDELRALLRSLTGAEVPSPLADAVCDHLEGWVAGAVLLATSWDRTATTNDHHTVLARGYEAAGEILANAVLEAVPDDARRLLLRTSCLPELSGPLCDLVTAGDGSRATLQALRSAGCFLFVGQRTASGQELVRFHHLARAALAERRSPADLDAEAAVLRAAAEWYGSQRLPVLAAECLALLEDWSACKQTLLANLPSLMANREFDDLARVLALLPTDQLLGDPLTAGGLAYLYMQTGRYRQALDLLGLLRKGAPPLLQLGCDVSIGASYAYLEDPTPALEAVERAVALADELGDTARFERNALNVATVLHYRTMGQARGLVAAAFTGAWRRGAPLDLEVDPAAEMEMPSIVVVMVHGQRAVHHALGGWLDRADDEIRSAVAAAVPDDLVADQNLIDAHLALAEVHRLRGEVEQVRPHLEACSERATPAVRHNYLAAVAAIRASLHLDLNQTSSTLEVVRAHRSATTHSPPPTIAGLLAAAEALALDASGEPQQARDVLTAAPDTSAVAAARVHIAVRRGALQRARRTITQWPDEPTPLSKVRRALAIAMVHEVEGHRRQAEHHLAVALDAAAVHGLLQPVTEVGVHVLRPLRSLATGSRGTPAGELAQRAIAALDRDTRFIASLTARERLVFEHLATGATVAAIAEQLVVSPNTVKAHTKAIYRKLGISTRSEVIAMWRPEGDATDR